jgi:hypothetical protein
VNKLRSAQASVLGLAFHKPPTKMGPVTIAIFEDTCGNLIQIAEKQSQE